MMALTYAPAGGPSTTVQLGERLVWMDEYEWTPVAQEVAHSTTGALLVDVATKQAGRPITLDGQVSNAWFARTVCNQLSTWAALPGAVFALQLRGQALQVIFDNGKQGFEAQSVVRLADGEETPEQLFNPILRFIAL